MRTPMISVRLPSDEHLATLRLAAERHQMSVSAIGRLGFVLALDQLNHQSATTSASTQEDAYGDQDQTSNPGQG